MFVIHIKSHRFKNWFKRGNFVPLTGGAADKYGNRFEAYWTIDQMLDIIDEKSDSIYLEPLGDEGKGVEFFVRKKYVKEFHQVKRQRTDGEWKPYHLKNILKNFSDKLNDSNVECVFVSTISSAELNDLTERSRDSNSYEQFKNDFLSSDITKTLFKYICDIWEKLEPFEVYNNLKRIYFETITERKLLKDITNRLESLIIGNSDLIISTLFEYGFQNIHKELDANDIWAHLNSRGFSPSDFSKNQTVLNKINQHNEQYENKLDFFTEYNISKNEVNYIIDNFESKNLMITGSAGSGKSNILLQTIKRLKTKKIPFLILDVDNLESANSAKELGENLGLPASPINVLKGISQNKNCVLIIDQLDNVSLVPSIRPEFFDCILDLIINASLYPNISLILSCRDFDLNYDPRLKKLLDEFDIKELEVKKLSKSQITEYIQYLKLDPELFNEHQFEILSIPLHLKLLSEIINDEDSDEYDFESTSDLYDSYWKTKQKDLNKRIGRQPKWNEVLDTLCEYMSSNNTLKVPEIFLDSYLKDAEAMTSEGVLFFNSKYYSFFHRSFFDYAFARRFVANNKDLIEFLESDEQHLFKRMPVRQILNYKRDMNYPDYIKDLKSLLGNDKIRFHIQKVIFELFSELINPKIEEWMIISPFILDKDSKLHNASWRIIYGSLDWFNLIDSVNFFKDNLDITEEYILDKILWVFHGILGHTDRVSDLLEPFINNSTEWNEKIINTFIWADLKQKKDFELFLRLIDEGIFESIPRYSEKDYWEDINYRAMDKLSENHPELSITIFSHYLNSKMELALHSGQKSPFSRDIKNLIPEYSFEEEDFVNIAEKSPEEFINQILPIFLKLLKFNKDKKSEKPFKDEIWRYKHYSSRRYHSSEIILYSLEIALSKLAYVNKKSFQYWESILKNSDFETAHFLLIRAYTINRKNFSKISVEYLLANNQSLEIGYLNNPIGASMQLISSIAPHCSYFGLKKLERLLLDYFTDISHFKWICTFYPKYCEEFRYYEFHKSDRQLNLLNSIPESLRSMEVRNRIKELSNQFGITYEEPKKMDTIIVTSPIPYKDAKNFTDDEWLIAIKNYDKKNEMLEGGPFELSNVLEKLTNEDPNRFAKLGLKFDDKTNIYYFEAILRGVASTETNVTYDNVIKICEKCHSLPNKPCGQWITQPIANLPGKVLSKGVLDIVSWYALNDPDPNEELWKADNSYGMEYYGGEIHNAGLNSVRGMVAHSISKIIYYNKNLIPYFTPILNKMVQDDSVAVRSCVAKALQMVSVHDKPFAIVLFKKLIKADDILLKTPYIARFVYYSLRDSFEEMEPVINRMILSKNPEVNEVGATSASYASLILENKLPQLNYSLYISEKHRLGVAKAFSEYLPYSTYPKLMIAVLSKLFSDPSENVRNSSYWSFRKMNDDNINDYLDLIKNFIFNKFSCSFSTLVHSLNDLKELPDISIDVCEQFFEISGLKAADIRRGSYGTAIHVTELILRIYGQTNDENMSKKCLDLIDYALEIDVHGVDSEINKFSEKYQN